LLWRSRAVNILRCMRTLECQNHSAVAFIQDLGDSLQRRT
jgi:hypothetical protein